jgi:hypothetical protein
MKKLTIVLLVVSLFVMALVGWSIKIKLMRLEVVNKSEYDAYLRLYDITLESPYEYYFHVPKTGALETTRLYTIPMGIYYVEASYCDQEWVTKFTDLNLVRSEFTIPIPPCDQKPVSDAVEDGVLKLSPWLYPPVDLNDVPIVYNLGGFSFHWRY